MLKKIIIVEDDAFLQDFYKVFFKKIGGEVLIQENADVILTEINKGGVELIIMDINLRNTYLNNQRIDGIKFSRYIKETFRQVKIPILLITAYPISSFGDNLLEDSLADDYLVKPIVDYNKLVDKINKLVISKNER
jgi:DNA-binding response OmpR family regulator